MTLSTAFAVLLGVSAYFVRDPTSIFWSKAVSNSGAGGLVGAVRAVPLVGAAGLGADDPAVRFSETHIGQVLYTKFSSDNCGRMLFDNQTGASYDAPEIFCGQKPGQVIEAESPDRLMALRKSFLR